MAVDRRRVGEDLKGGGIQFCRFVSSAAAGLGQTTKIWYPVTCPVFRHKRHNVTSLSTFPYFDNFDVSNLTTGLILFQSVFRVTYLQLLRLPIVQRVLWLTSTTSRDSEAEKSYVLRRRVNRTYIDSVFHKYTLLRYLLRWTRNGASCVNAISRLMRRAACLLRHCMLAWDRMKTAVFL